MRTLACSGDMYLRKKKVGGEKETNSQKKSDSPRYFVHMMKCEHGEKACAYKGHDRQRLVMRLFIHSIYFLVTVL